MTDEEYHRAMRVAFNKRNNAAMEHGMPMAESQSQLVGGNRVIPLVMRNGDTVTRTVCGLCLRETPCTDCSRSVRDPKRMISAMVPPWRYSQEALMKTEQASVFPGRAWARFPASREVLA